MSESEMECIRELQEAFSNLDKAHSEILFKQIKQEARIKILEDKMK